MYVCQSKGAAAPFQGWVKTAVTRAIPGSVRLSVVNKALMLAMTIGLAMHQKETKHGHAS